MRKAAKTQKKWPPNRIKELRKATGLSQEGLAQLTVPKTTNQMIGYLERSERELTYSWMERLAPHLGVADDPRKLMEPATSQKVDRDFNYNRANGHIDSGDLPVLGGVMTEDEAKLLDVYNRLSANAKGRLLNKAKALAFDELEAAQQNPTVKRA